MTLTVVVFGMRGIWWRPSPDRRQKLSPFDRLLLPCVVAKTVMGTLARTHSIGVIVARLCRPVTVTGSRWSPAVFSIWKAR